MKRSLLLLTVCAIVDGLLFSQDVVKLTGNFSVSDAGSANFSIPITLPPGAGGMKPALSINYSSNGGNGIMGLGWAFSGMAVIARGGKTIAQDGVTESPKFNWNDVYYLDGERLVLLTTNYDYGSDGAEYGTETNSFIKVVSVETSGQGPGFFEAYTKTGLKMTFGGKNESRIFAPGTANVLYYLLDKIEEHRLDGRGSYISYEYEKDEANGTYRPIKINYARNDNAPVSTNLTDVIFEYESRNDNHSAYLNGVKTSIPKRLKFLKILHRGQIKETYTFSYIEHGENNQSLMHGLSHCMADGKCANPLDFSWTVNETDLSFTPVNDAIPPLAVKGDNKEIYSEDLNNDGLTDIIIADRTSTLQIEIFLNKGNGQFAKIISSLQSASKSFALNFIDVNSDGFVDVVLTNNDGTNLWYINDKKINLSGAYFVPALPQINAADLQGNLNKQYFFIDFNGDSRLDFFIVDSDAGQFFLYENLSDAENSIKLVKRNLTLGISSNQLKDYYIAPADIDNDGKTDLLLHRRTNKEFNGSTLWYRNVYNPDQNVLFSLFSEDILSRNYFKTDAISIGPGSSATYATTNWQLRDNATGGCLFTRQPLTSLVGFPQFTDVNGDGLLDIILYQFHSETTFAGDNDAMQCQEKLMYLFINKGNFTFEPVINKSSSPINLGLTYPDYDNFTKTALRCYPGLANRTKHKGGAYSDCGSGNHDWYANTGVNSPWLRFRDNASYFLDLNGDGKSDMISTFSYRGTHGGFSGRMKKDLYINILVGNDKLICEDNIKTPINPENFEVTFGRFSRFGTDILLYNIENGNNVLYKNIADGRPPVITQFAGQLGGIVNVVYTSLNEEHVYTRGSTRSYPEIDFSSSGLIVENYSIEAPLEIVNVSYKYAEGVMNLTGRGFRGFKRVEMIDHIQNFGIVKEFEEDSRLIGSNLKSSRTYAENGVLLSEEIYKNAQLETKSDGTDTIYFPWIITVQDKMFTPFPYETQSRTYDLNGDLLVENTSRLELDRFGNVIYQVFEFGDGCMDSIRHEYDNDYEQWFIGRLLNSKVYKKCLGYDMVIREASFEYHPVTGLLVREVLEPNQDEKLRTVKTYEHDLFGNITKTTESAWNGSQVVMRTKTAEYDITGRFQVQSSNQLGHTVSIESDDYRGLPTRSTDENGLVTMMEYDSYGVLKQTTYPDGNFVNTNTQYLYTEFFPSYEIGFQTNISASSMPYSELNMDKAGREMSSSNTLFNGISVISTREYNNNNRLASVSDPFDPDVVSQVGYTDYEYDIAGRIVRTTENGNDDSELNYLYQYQGLSETITNPLQQVMTSVKDVRQRLKNATDNGGNQIQYKYDTEGNLMEISAGDNEYIIHYEYDLRGRMTAMIDPVLGREEYTYDGFNNLLSKKDGKGILITYTYDILNRVSTIAQSEGVVSFSYDQGNKAIGNLSKITYPNYERNLMYDDLGRLSEDVIVINDVQYVYKYHYNAIGKPDRLEHPSGMILKYHYNDLFYLYKITNNRNNKLLWQLNAVDTKNRPIEEEFGNGVLTSYAYDEQDNLISIRAFKGNESITHLTYEYNTINNKTVKTDHKNDITEEYYYDELNRLTSVYTFGQVNDILSMSYDKWGNILSKSDLGSYHYNQEVPTLLERIDTYEIDCDLPSSRFDYEYTSFNKISKITGDSVRVEVTYGPNNQRLTQSTYIHDQLHETRIYLNSDYEVLVIDNIETKRMSISGSSGIAVVYEVTANQPAKFNYLHRDDLGTVVAITNDLGLMQFTFQYDVWGKRRVIADFGGVLGSTYRGYTGHEHIAILELINMNGRIYDPLMGRFITPDPYIQNTANFQNLNRYSYVYNNPVNLVDPSGYFSVGKFVRNTFNSAKKTIGRLGSGVSAIANGNIRDGLKSFGQAYIDVYFKWTGGREVHRRGGQVFGEETWNQIVVASATIAVAYGTGGLGTGFGYVVMSGTAAGTTGGALSAHLAGAGTNDILKAGFRGGAIGGISAGLTYGVGHNSLIEDLAKSSSLSNQILGEGLRAIGHGMVQGTMNELQGGKFSQGFFNGMVSSIGSHAGNLYGTNPAGRVFAASIVGGSISSVTGGKFATGAVTGAFVELYNNQQRDNAVLEGLEETDRLLDRAEQRSIEGAAEVAKAQQNPNPFERAIESIKKAITVIQDTYNDAQNSIDRQFDEFNIFRKEE